MTDSGRLIREWRAAQQPPVTLVELAAKVGTSKGNLSRIEAGGQPVSEELLPAFVEVTKIPAHQLRPDLAKLFVGETAEAVE